MEREKIKQHLLNLLVALIIVFVAMAFLAVWILMIVFTNKILGL